MKTAASLNLKFRTINGGDRTFWARGNDARLRRVVQQLFHDAQAASCFVFVLCFVKCESRGRCFATRKRGGVRHDEFNLVLRGLRGPRSSVLRHRETFLSCKPEVNSLCCTAPPLEPATGAQCHHAPSDLVGMHPHPMSSRRLCFQQVICF